MTTSAGKKNIVAAEERQAGDLIGRIRKLRWIDLEHEAAKLQRALALFPPAQRGILLAVPGDTD